MLGSGGVAHRLEQAAHNHLVVGSIPTAPTRHYLFTPKIGIYRFLLMPVHSSELNK